MTLQLFDKLAVRGVKEVEKYTQQPQTKPSGKYNKNYCFCNALYKGFSLEAVLNLG
jgi:hypothetical protein